MLNKSKILFDNCYISFLDDYICIESITTYHVNKTDVTVSYNIDNMCKIVKDIKKIYPAARSEYHYTERRIYEVPRTILPYIKAYFMGADPDSILDQMNHV